MRNENIRWYDGVKLSELTEGTAMNNSMAHSLVPMMLGDANLSPWTKQ
jgi:hypothetical protein